MVGEAGPAGFTDFGKVVDQADQIGRRQRFAEEGYVA